MERTKTFNILPIMKNDISRLKIFIVFVFFTITSLVNAQSIFENAINGSSPSSVNPFTAGQTVSTGITVSGIGLSNGVNSAPAGDRFNADSWTTSGNINTGDYFSWTLTPSNCFEIDFTNLVVAYQRSGNGPQNLALRSSADNYASNIWTTTGIPASEQTSTISLSLSAFQNLTTPITFRLYGWNAGNGNGTFSVNSFTFNGAVNSLNTAVAGTISGTSSVCFGNTSDLTLTGSTGNIQWETSTNNTTFTAISGATSATYTTPNLTATAYYRAALTTGTCPTVYSSSYSVGITTPSFTAINGTGCYGDAVNLGVSNVCPPSGAITNWYAASTGGASLGTGNSFTTSALNATTTYYANLNFTAGATLATGNRSATLQRGLVFDAYVPFLLNSVQINTNGAGSITLELRDNLNQPVAGVSAVVFSAAAGTNTVPLGWTIPVGSGYSIIKTAGTIQFSRTDPFTFPIGVNGVLSITSSVDAGVVDNTRYFYFYNWNVSSLRIPVVATMSNQNVPTFTQVSSICSGATLSALPTTSNNSITGTWAPALNNTATTTYTFTPTAGQCASTATMTITVNPALTASVSIAAGATTICSGTSVTFTATPTNGGTTPSYQWKVNGTNVGTNASTYASTTLANNDVVTCVMTSNATPCLTGSPATSNGVTMVVNPVLSASVSIAASATTICAGTSVTFTATPTNGGTTPSYQWKVNGTNAGTNSATFTSATLANNDVVTCVMTSNATPCLTGSPATSNGLTMVVNPVLTASVSIAATATTICSGTSVTFTATPTNGGTTPTYVWKKNGTTISGATASTYSTTALVNSDVITCVMTSNATPCLTGSPATSNAVTMTVNPTPTVTNASICVGGSAQLAVTSSCSDITGQTSGPNDATVGTNVAGVGTIAWSTPGNITAIGTPYATASLAQNAITNYLRGTGYGFSIPTDAIVTGISVVINKSSSGTTSPFVTDSRVSLVKGGTIQTTNKAVIGTNWSNNNVFGSTTYGGSADLWNTTWTAADINNANFGVVLSATNASTNARTASVDYMRITVTYTIPGTLNWYTVSSGGSIIATGSTLNPVGVANSGLTNTNTAGITPYYVSCSTATGACRAQANFEIKALPTAPVAVSSSRCGTGTVNISATAGVGETIDWYAAASGGTSLSSGSISYTTPSISTTTVYYAEARNTTLGCVSSTRTAVTATVNPILTASVSIAASATTICSGASVTFTATPTNGGTTPAYVWKKNGTTISGATASTYTTTALANNDVVTCELTSNASPCLTGSPATSNGVTMVVNPIVTPTFTQVAAICSGASLNALPTTSNNSITGTWSPALNNTATTTYTFTPTAGQCASTATMTITVNPLTNNTTTASACDSYTWSVNGTTYTTSGTYTSVSGCHTETLVLTITPSTNNTTTASACDSYTWSVNGTTYTTSGTYTSVTECHTETLVLTITPSTNNTTTASACDSYTWSVNGTTYTTSGTYTSVTGCHTETLVLTITTSTNNTTTASACDSYTWSVNGTTYTTSGTYTSVTGCHTETLVLTITPSTNNTTTASACDSYAWSVNGTTYTTSGTYTSVTGCHTETLVLTITPSTNNTTTASACDSYTWSVNGTTYTTSGTYTSVTGCHTETLVLNVNTSSIYYVDADGDGFGSTTTANFCAMPSTGYSLNNTDCNDAVSSTYPGATEWCNSVDDNCSGFIDEGCPSTIAGEEPFNSILAPSGMYSYCSSFYGTLAGTFPSANAHSSCVTGEDVWYNFVAQSSGVTVFIGSYVNDIVIELQDANGNLVEIENTVNGPGTEVLTTTNLIAGQEYRIGIRNNNGILNPGGAFSACVRHLRRGGADSGTSSTWPSTLSTCSLFKASYCGGTGVQYRYTWTGISGTATGQVFTKTQTSDYLNVTAVSPALHAGSTYNVLVTAIYTIPNGAGVNEVVELSALAPSTITISAVANVALRSADQLTNGPRYRGSVVAALPWVCGVSNWRWRFTEVNPLTLQTVGLPIEQNRAAASNFINLNTVAALQYGKTYAVQSAPLFTYTGTNYQWGPVTYMAIIGSAGMIVDPTEGASQGSEKDALQGPSEGVSQGAMQEMELSVFPNPSNGSDLNLNISGIESDNVQVKVYDTLGRKIESKRYVVDGTLQTTLNFANELSNGLYILEVTTEDVKRSIRFMVEQ